ncbi:receptor-type tyrosine-protein phosphatase O isoform X1 [Scyliorhinus canicula]|uniref:receptor-type tyrosine-protein phosphatase O isoform X1 n=2 Tax=Scyliorhinus canicula TaxID=7830 RepID=UPI0018F43F96|nr:receptor-type tyrosine-protein phosphatase O isoform X1 [Scyliorhinus canicula]XP_038667080.1 receptor-type tyrosine-protein phosphatase O isoform X1 [Scyliorhinus canicula]
MHWELQRGAVRSMVLFIAYFLFAIKSVAAISATVSDDNKIIVSLQPSDVINGSSLYYVKITQSVNLTNYKLQFKDFNSTLPPPVVFNASYHGIYYLVTLLTGSSKSTVKPVHLVAVLTKPLPVNSVNIYDYKQSPQTGVLFDIQYPKQTTNFFSRLKLSYFEGNYYRSSFHKDFLKGKLIFNTWLSGICYSNITFQLVAEANVNRLPLMEYSAVGHEPKHHRTVPYPPSNVSMKVVYRRSKSVGELHAGREQFLLNTNKTVDKGSNTIDTEANELTANQSVGWGDYELTNEGGKRMIANWALEFQPDSKEISASGYDYLDVMNVTEDDPQNIMYTTMEPASSVVNPETVWLVLEWFPPKPYTAYDSFNIYIQREGTSAEVFTVQNNTYMFELELREAGKYNVNVTTVSSYGICQTRESSFKKALTFYLSPSGKWFKEVTERPQNVAVKVLNSITALVSWTHSQENNYDSIVSIVSLSCQQQLEGRRIESFYCSKVNLSSNIIGNLMPGAYYQVVVYLKNGPAIGPPSLPLTFGLSPSGVKNLILYPLSPTAVVLSWSRPYSVVFKKYVVEMYHHDPVNRNSKWKTIQDIPFTIALTTSMTVTDLQPAARYEFRVTMVSWGEPENSCCDRSLTSYITAPLAPEITWLEYSKNILSVSWTYGDATIRASNSTLPYWLVVAVGRRIIKKSVPHRIMTTLLQLPPGDTYNLTVVAYTEGSSNASAPRIIQLQPASPKSLFAVNKTQTSVTLLWVEEGVIDHYQVTCKQVGTRDEGKKEEATVYSPIVTLTNLVPSTAYNCSVTSVSYERYSAPVFITVSTTVTEVNSNMVVISALAILSILLIGLLLITLFVLRRKHLQHARNCGAGIFVNFATLERDGKLPFNWRRSIFAVLALLPSCLWTDYLLAFGINPWNKYALKKRKLANPVQLDDFELYLKDMGRDSDYKFSLQFEDLKLVGQDISHDAAELPVNRCKNRYTNILPYDFSRVKLTSMHSEEGLDYINANYVPGFNSAREYIATQGPLAETRNDFWKMIMQQKSCIIVMLTQCTERRRVKCDHYWPFNEQPVGYGDITVEMVFESEQPDQSESRQSEWIIREFNVSYADEVQRVIHYNYVAWPDHGVPTGTTAENILQFVQLVRQETMERPGPIMVHCSAGVGRTGTFIALDRLMQHIVEHEYVDILGLVAEMRNYRTSMVQTEEQYIFIHRCVQLMWKKRRQQYSNSDVIYENSRPSQL